jgi:hypothetical protein
VIVKGKGSTVLRDTFILFLYRLMLLEGFRFIQVSIVDTTAKVFEHVKQLLNFPKKVYDLVFLHSGFVNS